jgi:hypothetical protein
MTTLPTYRVKVAPFAPEMATGPSAPPTVLCLDFNDPATSRQPSSFLNDVETGRFPYEWGNLAEFDMWRRTEELAYSIELISKEVQKGTNGLWTLKRDYVCSRGYSGGRSKYQKKEPDRQQKIGSKKTGCHCKLVIKLYPHTPIVRGRYENDHNHEIGLANIAFTRMSPIARERINNMLQQKVDPREIVRK